MDATISFIRSHDGALTVYCNGDCLLFAADHPKMDEVKQAIRDKNTEKLVELAKPVEAMRNYVNASASNWKEGEPVVSIKDGVVYYMGEPQSTKLAEKILEFQREGFPVEPLFNFLEKLMRNPSKRAVDELWNFLEHHGIPITEDGDFIAWKRVKSDMTDCYSGKVLYKIGEPFKIKRNTVDEDWRVACSSGIHVGALSYVNSFNNQPDFPILVVKVNPEHVVSVPGNETNKMRVCEGLPLGIYNGTTAPNHYHAKPEKLYETPYGNDDDDDDDDDDDYDNDYHYNDRNYA